MDTPISKRPRSAIWLAFGMFLIGLRTLSAAPVRVIFDTDMGGDCDDVGALFVLHGALELGEVDLLATMGCVSSDAIAPAIDGINTWFGRPGIPVGTLKDPGLLEGPHYTEELAKHYPGRLPRSKDYPDAVRLYREVLAAQPDQSVIIVAVGPLRNIANLLESGADAVSDLDGAGLVERKVKRLDIMGGKYPPQPSKDAKDAEWNFAQCARSAAKVCEDWPTPILFNGEGGSTLSGRRATYEMPEHNPLTMAYTLYPGSGYGGDRMSWDPISCLVTVRGAEPWYEVVGGGRNVVDPGTGSNRWQQVEGGRHSYLVLKSKKVEVEAVLEDYLVAGKGRPADLNFNTAYYGIKGGACQFTGTGDDAARKAFDGDGKTAWLHRAESTWLQCHFGEGKRHLATSYAVTANDAGRLPSALALSGSNDGGATWTVLDEQGDAGFTAGVDRREFPISEPGKWNLFRLQLTSADPGEGVQIAGVELLEHIRCRPGSGVRSVALDHQQLTLRTGQRVTLNASLAPLDSWEREVVWTSSDPAVAEVRRIGEQSAVVVGKVPGAATITANLGGANAPVTVTITPSPLPAGWEYLELGDPPMPGAVEVGGGSFTITGSGHAMSAFWERVRDQGSYVHRPAGGDFAVSACLRQIAPDVGGPAYQWDSRPPTASGLMLRESLTEPLSRFVLIQVEASGKLVARWRDTISQDDNQKQELGKVGLPVHLRLVRQGKSVQVFTSADGQHWGDPKFACETPISEGASVGMFVCSGNTFATTTARFDGVQLGN
ncbi:MAG: nucleoside hydrolase [Akkermansiaceae bacterium]